MPRFHDLRHTYVSMLIAMGWNITRVSRQVGHESVRTTIDLYGHLWEGLDDDMAGLNRLLNRLDEAEADNDDVAREKLLAELARVVTEAGLDIELESLLDELSVGKSRLERLRADEES